MSQADAPLTGPSDADLVAACRRGRREAFGELVTRHQGRVFNLAFRLSGNHDDAAEITQEAFLKAYKALGSFRSDSAFYTWVFRIAVNTARSRQRFRAVRPKEVSLDANPGDNRENSRDRRSAFVADLRSADAGPVEEASRAEHRRLVGEGVAKLNEEQRMLIVLRDLEGRNYGEIADLLDCPRGTVKSRLHRARMALRDILMPVLGEAFEA